MNHLPWPNNVDVPPLEIPYVCDEIPDYESANFLDYPITRGWSTPEDPCQWIHTSSNILGKRAQSWLFFGLLQVLIGRRIDEQEYTAPSHRSNGWVINTTRLPVHCSELVRKINRGGCASNGELVTRGSLRATWNAVYLQAKLHFEVLNSHLPWEDDQSLYLITEPIPILLQTMKRVANEIFLFHDEYPPMCDIDPHPSIAPLCRMLDWNWCPSQAGNIYRYYSPSVIHYLSGLPRQHLTSHSQGCSWNGCVANNVNEDSYKTQHSHEACSCQSVGPDPRKLAQIIHRNHIPIVKLRIVDGVPELSLVAAQLGTKYVTMSHVWAGGLGNFKENKLPTCQLQRLYGLLNDLDKFRPPDPNLTLFKPPPQRKARLDLTSSIIIAWDKSADLIHKLRQRSLWEFHPQSSHAPSSNVFFWMDTLCVPVHPEASHLRKKAINNMNLIYAAAERCLVLDPELQQIPMKDLSPVQLNAHVLCCTWLTRSWTFQEARLSRAWYARFADGFYNPNSQENSDLNYRVYCDLNVYKSDAHNLSSEMISWYTNMPAMRETDIFANRNKHLISDELYSFISIWNHLVSRSTSKMEDVNGILANTLDLSAGEVLALPAEQRMKAIFQTQEKLPAGLMFNNAKKVADSSSRWVPLYPEEARLSEHLYGALTASPNGFYLDNVNGNPVGFLVSPSVPRYQRIRLLDSSDAAMGPLWISFNEEPDGFPVDYKTPACGDDGIAAVVYLVGDLRKSLEQQAVGRNPQGARFALKKKEGKTLHLVFEYSFYYNHHRMREYRESTDVYMTVHAHRTEEDAIFHVDCSRNDWPMLTYRRDTTSTLSAHGLYFYIVASIIIAFLVWTPFYYVAWGHHHRFQTVIPDMVLIIRTVIGFLQLRQLYDRISEHAYTSWVKTFDETGSFRRSPTSAPIRKYITLSEWVLKQKSQVSIGISLSICAIAVFAPAVYYMMWLALAMVVEVVVGWVVQKLWWGTRVGTVTKSNSPTDPLDNPTVSEVIAAAGSGYITRCGASTLQNLDAILQRNLFASMMSWQPRLVIWFVFLLPLGLGASYKKFSGGSTDRIIQASEMKYGVTAAPGYQLIGNGLSLLVTVYFPFWLDPAVGRTYGFNLFVADNNTAAIFDAPLPSDLTDIQSLLDVGQSVLITAPVNVTVTELDPKFFPLVNTRSALVASMLWSRMVSLEGIERYDQSSMLHRNILYGRQSEEIRMIKRNTTLKRSPWLIFILSIHPVLTILAMLAKAVLFRTPISDDFGLISLLAGIHGKGIEKLRGAALSGKVSKKMRVRFSVAGGRDTGIYHRLELQVDSQKQSDLLDTKKFYG
ncbi:MAG: hypothetical protein Q9209_001659 [Squamulea sp. 1 TL-2023]